MSPYGSTQTTPPEALISALIHPPHSAQSPALLVLPTGEHAQPPTIDLETSLGSAVEVLARWQSIASAGRLALRPVELVFRARSKFQYVP